MERRSPDELADTFSTFFEEYLDESQVPVQDEVESLPLDYDDVYRFDNDLADSLLEDPIQVLGGAKYGAQDFVSDHDLSGDPEVHVINLPKETAVEEIDSDDINQLVQITGTVHSAESVFSKIVTGVFRCIRCETLTQVAQEGANELQEPHQCRSCERQGPFRLNEDQTDFDDAQTIYLEQRSVGLGTDEEIERLRVDLDGSLVGKAVPGERVTVTGILRFDNDLDDTTSTIPDKRLKAVGVRKAPHHRVEITEGDEERIFEIANGEDPVDTLVSSFAPTIHGHEDKKLALLLQLFSGVTKELPDGSRIRGDIHVALIGDTGTAKSKLARYAARVSPRSVAVSGTVTSTVGLTLSAERVSSGTSRWKFEAGALPKADQGLAYIDSVAGLSDPELAALGDVLEDQQVRASKGSATVSMAARAAVLATDTPANGGFDEYQPVAEQLGLPPNILSQFDLIFTVTDDQSKAEAEEVADHVIETHRVGELEARDHDRMSTDVDDLDVEDHRNEIDPEVSPETLRKYIVYAQKHVTPRITDGAKDTLQDFYVSIKSQQSQTSAPEQLPVTVRAIEALVRLAEARARMRLADNVTEADAEAVVELVETTLEDFDADPERGQFDADIIETGTSKSQRDRIRNLKALIDDLADEYEEGVPVDAIYERAGEIGIGAEKAERELEKLKQKGEVFEPNPDEVRRT